MADEKKEPKKELRFIQLCVVENGYKLECQYDVEPSLAVRAGWVPPSYMEPKVYVEKTKDAVLKRLKEIL